MPDDIMVAAVEIDVSTQIKWEGWLSKAFVTWIETESDSPPIVTVADEDTISVRKFRAAGTSFTKSDGVTVKGIVLAGVADSQVSFGKLTINVWQRGGKKAEALKPVSLVVPRVILADRIVETPTSPPPEADKACWTEDV